MSVHFVQEGKSIDHTPGSAVSAGDVVVQGDLIGVAKLDIAANALGALAIVGVFDFPKVTGAISAGDEVFWDDDGDPVGGTAGSGAVTKTAADGKYCGVAIAGAAESAETVRIVLQSLPALTGDVVSNGNSATLDDAHAEQSVIVPVEDLAADGDIAARPIFVHPRAVTIVSVGILTQGSPAGVDDANTAVLALKDDAANTILTKTYDTANQPPDGDYEDLGTPDATHKVLAAGEHVTLDVTQGTTADLPAFSLVIRYIPTNAA